MEELIAQVITIAKGMWRFRWPSLAVAWLVAIVGVVIVFRVPDKYEATARIYVDTQSILKPLMSGLAVQPNVEQQVVDAQPHADQPAEHGKAGAHGRPRPEERVQGAAGRADHVADDDARRSRTPGATTCIRCPTATPNPAKAQKVIQSLVSIFVESSLGAIRKDTESAKVFLDEQIKSYEAKLEEAESKLKEFRLRNIDLQAAEGKDSASRLRRTGRAVEAGQAGAARGRAGA